VIVGIAGGRTEAGQADGRVRARHRAPRVVFIGHSAAWSGAEISLTRLLDHLPDVEATVLLAEDGPLADHLRDMDIDHRVVPLSDTAAHVSRAQVTAGRLPLRALSDTMAYTVRLARVLRRLRPDIVHTNSMKAHLYGGVAAAIARVPHVWHARDRAAVDYLPRPTVALVRLAARVLPSVLIANSHSTLDTYPGARRGVVVYNGVPTHPNQPTPAPGPPLRVGIVGRLAPWKGQHLFLDAFAAAFADGRQQAVVIGGALFGEEAYEADLKTRAERLGIGDRVDFTGFTDDVPGHIENLDVLVHCSTIPEPFGQVVVEGMAAGRAVVAADAGGPAEIIDAGRSGLLVPPGDVAGLADALRRLDDDPALRARLGAAAYTAAQDLTPQRCAEQVAAVYMRLAPRRGLRRRPWTT
jgi:glycosyltransferase involved in cell wall biosynthesis